ncbi:MAG: NERD domain-containing protein [Gammaproteobacteria bacterium]|nr:NERD domain-containing protein [Gammaproteobacteria bacterium]
MPELSDTQLMYSGLGVAIALLILIVVIWRWRAGRSLKKRLEKSGVELLSNILIPNGEGGEIHIEHVLLTRTGVVVIEVKDVEGNVFGSDSMQDWTVISEKRRFTFSNPQTAFYDRVAAVRRLLPDVPVKGYIAFLPKAEFTKGRPTDVIEFESMLDELHREMKSTVADSVDDIYPQWSKLRDEAVATQVGQLLKD